MATNGNDSTQEKEENVCIIWFNPETPLLDNTLAQIKKELSVNKSSISFHNDIDQCIDLIKSLKNTKVFLIISGNNILKYRSQIDNLPKLYAIFIFPEEPEKYERVKDAYSEIVGIFGNTIDLIKSITKKLRFVNEQDEIISFYHHHQQGARELSERSGNFLW